jgi:hypothetical protein
MSRRADPLGTTCLLPTQAAPEAGGAGHELRLAISTFASARDNRPRPRTVSLTGLLRALASFRQFQVTDKRELPAWSPARFGEGAGRRGDAVVEVSCLVYDLDDADLDAVAAGWHDVLHLLHTTWSHTPEAPRWRLVVPLARAVPGARWAEAWTWGARRTPGADGACKDAGRLYFVPAIRHPEQLREARCHHGPVLDLLARLPIPTTLRVAPTRPLVHVPARLVGQVVRRRLDHDPGTRERVADAIGARLAGVGTQRRAEGATCPACRRQSVWFWIAPTRQRAARCHHQGTCGWWGRIDEILVVTP